MISFSLQCSNGHRFDAWFSSSDAFDMQAERGLLSCPVCGDEAITRALMAPAVRPSRKAASVPVQPTEPPRGEATLLPPERPGSADNPDSERLRTMIRALREAVRENGTDVGAAFPEEARKIHYGETEERGIYGQASLEEAKSLVEEGIEILPIPSLPDDKN